MNVHQNAKLTPAGRALLVERLLAGERTEDVVYDNGVDQPIGGGFGRPLRAFSLRT